MRLDVDSPCEIWLKLECLQPIGSFKLRGATNAIRRADPAEWRAGVWTTSAGNMAQGVCWVARELGVPATVVAPGGNSPRSISAYTASTLVAVDSSIEITMIAPAPIRRCGA